MELEPRGIWGLVLAGSYPNHRSPLDRLRPRPLLPIAQRPVISYPLRWLAGAGVEGITVCANGSSAAVLGAVAVEIASSLPLVFQEDRTPRGTAGSARDAALATGARAFLVVNGTTIPDVDPRALLLTHEKECAAATVVVRSDRDSRGGELDPVGIYTFDRTAFEHVTADGFQDIKETLLPRLHQAGRRVVAHTSGGSLSGVLSTETYLAANERMIPIVLGEAPGEGFHQAGSARVHTTALISPRARVVGPVIVGEGARIEEGATLVGPSALGRGCHVGTRAIVSRSVAWDHCVLGRESLLDRCVVTDGAVVEPGTRLYGAIKTGAGRGRATGTPFPVASPQAKDRAAAPAVAAAFRVRNA